MLRAAVCHNDLAKQNTLYICSTNLMPCHGQNGIPNFPAWKVQRPFRIHTFCLFLTRHSSMLAATINIARMSRNRASAVTRTRAIAAHMSTAAPEGQSVLFESNGSSRKYVLNRAKKLNALNSEMLQLIRPQVEEWSKSDLCKVIVGTGVGRAFCAGGDVATVLNDSLDDSTRSRAIEFFKEEFELDYVLSALPKPYVALLDGITMGGGVGLAISAPFRVATEKTVFAMPETKIGYCPDVGASFFLSRMDGEIGTYLALTSETLVGREVFEHGLATHFIPSRAISNLLDRLADLPTSNPERVNLAIEELHAERQSDEPLGKLTGATRQALDSAFAHDSVELIVQSLEEFTSASDRGVSEWAKKTLETLHMRSPTSLKVSLSAIRRGKTMTLFEALQMEMGIATSYCSGASSDFRAGISAVLIDKTQGRPAWSPSSLKDVSPMILDRFFSKESPYRSNMPELSSPEFLHQGARDPMRFALPTEEDIALAVKSISNERPMALPVLLSRLDDVRSGKAGVREKVLDVLKRRCKWEVDDGSISTVCWKQ
ncbi:ClpP/crotonase-like domain-containing protein [Hygrophoropsis aurantiaca]|uniref:ClpP/crotonase-like domain-containing protein n=1 Tax=Hygrophoropsis aurantiaca TaxID=72124 RepID=A0ACB8AE62_9AGAM|nr:ClpP/crotonase-like domain-containing protein [Hygrophoropsis aurantiaca]